MTCTQNIMDKKKLIWHCNKRIGDLILHSATNLQKYTTEELANTNGPYPTYEFSTEHPTYVVFTYMCLFVLTSSDCMSRQKLMKIRIWRTIFITFNYAATIDLQILFSLHMRHLSKEQVACARLIIAFFFLYSEIEMIVPPIILTNPLLPHKSFQFMCMILKQKKSTKHRISMRET